MNRILQLSLRKNVEDGRYYCVFLEQSVRLTQSTIDLSGIKETDATGLITLVAYAARGNTEYLRSAVEVQAPVRMPPRSIAQLFDYATYHKTTSLEFYADEIILNIYPQRTPAFVPYHRPELEEIVKGLMPTSLDSKAKTDRVSKPLFICKHCAAVSYDEKFVKTVTSSVGKEYQLCRRCARPYTCNICKFDEPEFLIRKSLYIDENTGEDKSSLICVKCRRDHTEHSCGYYFQGDVCPCQFKQDFKGFIEAHNADVLNHCQMDQYCNELFGIEIEAGTLFKNRKFFPEIAKSTNNLIKCNAILKYDSSIDFINKNEGIKNEYRGFEVVTRPMVYKNTLRFIRDFCKNRHPLLRSWEVGTCGLHIHVSKACLRPFEIGKILEFINAKGNRSFIRMIAKREDKRFAKFLPKKIMDYANTHPNCHYEAVNTSKPFTIEFRIFRGTLNPKTLVSYLQFVKSVIEFVRVTSKDNLTYKTYVEFLCKTEKSQFRELKERLKSEKLTKIADYGEI